MSKFQESEIQDMKQMNCMVVEYSIAVASDIAVSELYKLLKKIKGFVDAKVERYEEDVL